VTTAAEAAVPFASGVASAVAVASLAGFGSSPCAWNCPATQVPKLVLVMQLVKSGPTAMTATMTMVATAAAIVAALGRVGAGSAS